MYALNMSWRSNPASCMDAWTKQWLYLGDLPCTSGLIFEQICKNQENVGASGKDVGGVEQWETYFTLRIILNFLTFVPDIYV